jgi:uncharacterized protein (TIGR02145 family)
MFSNKFIRILISGVIIVCLFTCKPADIILHGEITGTVTDALTEEAVKSAYVTFNQSTDTVTTDGTGHFVIRNLTPGDYEIQATKSGYVTGTNTITLGSTESRVVDFVLNQTPVLKINVSYLDFGLDKTQLYFTISNTGKGNLRYGLLTSQSWITVDPSSGDLANQLDSVNITVNIDKTGLPVSKDKQIIKVSSFNGLGSLPDTVVDVYLNGVMDKDKNYYNVVTIGTQTWMAENLRVGINHPVSSDQTDNGIIEYYTPNIENYNTYGGLYQWNEMMGYYLPLDDNPMVTTQGICPDGWHVPTSFDVETLKHNLQGGDVAGGKLKENGFLHWLSPNKGATNESGFSALPGGIYGDEYIDYDGIYRYEGLKGFWWYAERDPTYDNAFVFILRNDSTIVDFSNPSRRSGCSVRCVKDQP